MLFAPANHRRHASKALASQADAAILDLEDAVAEDEKVDARQAVQVLLGERPADGPAAFVRINALTTPFAYPDLVSVIVKGLDGIVLPKVESAAQVATVHWFISQLEAEHGLDPGTVQLLPIIETATGLTRIDEIATASARVAFITFGAGDFTLDNNMEWTPGNEAVLWARVQTVIASRAAGLSAPVDTVFPALADREGFIQEAKQARQLGFQGKLCIHPSRSTWRMRSSHRVPTGSPERAAFSRRSSKRLPPAPRPSSSTDSSSTIRSRSAHAG